MSRRFGRLFAGTATVSMVLGLTVAGAGTALADQAYTSPTLTYTCNYPLIGENLLEVQASFQGPSSVTGGGTFQAYGVTAVATVPADVVSALYYLGGIDGVRGSADASVAVTNGSPATVNVSDLGVGEQFVPDPDAAFPVNAAQTSSSVVPAITAGSTGQVLTAALGETFSASLDFHYTNATPEWQGPEAFDCTLNEGQNAAFSPSLTIG
ncbi:DUF6801 domain-containing protein [Amycolatopsis magusensis]|uniref:DUF6801 domain-containing protein n=1 Tax=Amycolatopsis magusensis TaxID=882444 RepID=A0ABS4Q494_9PSEU|nr:DUF6801 domain-containing protein [Amycolatopsis magusensis]MBP2186501.1 hypothetical protein [Amycolatopsis magusensis]MDI5981538.1 hypothetical protein [Amycolatopsis magusensis]